MQPQRMKQTHRRARASGTQPRKMKQAHRLAWSLARGLVAGIGPYSGRIPPLTSITHDKYGSLLNTREQAQVMENAQKLARLGFQQQTKRAPPCFYIKQDDGRFTATWTVGILCLSFTRSETARENAKRVCWKQLAKFLTNTESRTGDALKIQKAMTMPCKEWWVSSRAILGARR